MSDELLTAFLSERSMPEPNSGCVLWLGAVEPNGYGAATWHKKQRTHRLAWMASHGPIPAGMLVCHKCDVRSCINPDHLFLGTPADNMADKVAKGRGATPRGEASGSAKLTEQEVLLIRADSRTHRAIARDYGVDHSVIGDIKRGVAWTHVGGQP